MSCDCINIDFIIPAIKQAMLPTSVFARNETMRFVFSQIRETYKQTPLGKSPDVTFVVTVTSFAQGSIVVSYDLRVTHNNRDMSDEALAVSCRPSCLFSTRKPSINKYSKQRFISPPCFSLNIGEHTTGSFIWETA